MTNDFQKALSDPKKHFGTPSTVLEDTSLSTEQKRQILERWETDAIHLQDSETEGFGGGERSQLDEIEKALKALV